MGIEDYFKAKRELPTKEQLERLSRYTIQNDRYDVRQLENLLKQVPEFAGARRTLVDTIAGDPGYDIGGDMLWGFFQVVPQPIEDGEIRPSRRVNSKVRDEAFNLEEFDRLRQWTRGDEIGSALAFKDIEPRLEEIYDQLQEAQKRSEEYEQKLADLAQAISEQRDAEQIWEDWKDAHPDDEDEDGEGQGLAQDAKDAEGETAQAQAAAEQAEKEMEDELDGAGGSVRSNLKQGLEEAADNAETMNNAGQLWGHEMGSLHRLPAKKRLELAKKVQDSPTFKRVCQLFGSIVRFAQAEQRRRINSVPEEIYDIEKGDNLARVLPTELMLLDEDELELLFYKDFMEKNLLQYAMQGHEKVAKGGIILCHDGSSSMRGEEEIWAKAVGLALLVIAKKQRRSFYGIQFGSKRDPLRIDDFRDTSKIGMEQVIDFAEFFINGGTDFQKPLDHALTILEEEHDRFGATKADIVFVTDGYCGVQDDWMREFKEKQKKLGFKVFGVIIGAGTTSEPLATICDGKVMTVTDLTKGEDVKEVFASV